MHVYLTADEVRRIPAEDLPLVVLTDNLRSWLALRIRRHTHGYYNHAMIMSAPGVCVSQGLLYREVSIEWYLKRARIKFWHDPGWTVTDKIAINNAILDRMCLPWHRRLYDWLGIVGQLLGQRWNWLRWIQDPRRYYCSEDVARVMRAVDRAFRWERPSPADLNRYFKGDPKWEEYARYDPDD